MNSFAPLKSLATTILAAASGTAILFLILMRPPEAVAAQFSSVAAEPMCALRIPHEMALNVHLPPRHATAFANPERSAGITVASHMTVDRFGELQRWCREWLGPMSVAIFAPSLEVGTLIVEEMVRRDHCVANFVALHVTWCSAAPVSDGRTSAAHIAELFARAARRGMERKKPSAPGLCGKYPFNLQRNAAIEGADDRSEWIFLTDIDLHLLPRARGGASQLGMYFAAVANDILRLRAASTPSTNATVVPTAWVVPVAETRSRLSPFPATISELREGLQARWAQRFYPVCPRCYRFPNLTAFVEASLDVDAGLRNSSDKLAVLRESWVRTTVSPFPFYEGTEPFCILPRRHLPPFDDLFVGRHLDKISYLLELLGEGFRFEVLPSLFLLNHGQGDGLGPSERPTADEYHYEMLNDYHYVITKLRVFDRNPKAPLLRPWYRHIADTVFEPADGVPFNPRQAEAEQRSFSWLAAQLDTKEVVSAEDAQQLILQAIQRLHSV